MERFDSKQAILLNMEEKMSANENSNETEKTNSKLFKNKDGRKPKNLYNKMEWAGAFGDIGTLIPFVVAYITIVKVEPLGLLFMF